MFNVIVAVVSLAGIVRSKAATLTSLAPSGNSEMNVIWAVSVSDTRTITQATGAPHVSAFQST
ncbi:MAG TPA: hypothetical protein PKH33_16470, partial [bacterium]|nr:hypothetical protein [bacterium]